MFKAVAELTVAEADAEFIGMVLVVGVLIVVTLEAAKARLGLGVTVALEVKGAVSLGLVVATTLAPVLTVDAILSAIRGDDRPDSS